VGVRILESAPPIIQHAVHAMNILAVQNMSNQRGLRDDCVTKIEPWADAARQTETDEKSSLPGYYKTNTEC